MTEPTPETLPTGELVLQYPDGRQVLQSTNSLAVALDNQVEEQLVANEALTEALVQAAIDKREALADGNEVPADKRVV